MDASDSQRVIGVVATLAPSTLDAAGDVGAEANPGGRTEPIEVPVRIGLGNGRWRKASEPLLLGVYGEDRTLLTCLLRALFMQPAK